MKVISDPSEMQVLSRKWRRGGKTLGFVPTMGALHEGHLRLVRASVQENAFTVASIYVNPLQFGPKEDFKQYPRALAQDLKLLSRCKVQAVFTPSDREMYPDGFSTQVRVTGGLVRGLCAVYRPGHFDGVATVVVKLLGAVLPTRLYLGQKDAQQAAVLRQVVKDLNLDVLVRVHPTVREKDGLAMSSRNKRLSPEGRRIAPVLYRALRTGKDLLKSGDARTIKILSAVRKVIAQERKVKLQYLEAVDPKTLEPVQRVKSGVLLILAAYLENVRLIDNIIV